MKIAILETVKASAGFELEFDRIIIEALQDAGHEPILLTPKNTVFDQDFHIPVKYLSGGEIVSYDGAKGLTKIWRSIQREKRRVKWFDSAMQIAEQDGIQAILLTTATYRYLRALKKSRMKNGKVPVYFIFLGVNPSERPKFMEKAKQCLPYLNIHLCVTTLRDDFGKARPKNVKLLPPPVMIPKACPEQGQHNPLKIGFFGHYRKGEKNLDWLMKAIQQANFQRPVQFVLQIVPTTEADRAEVMDYVQRYQSDSKLVFITHKLLGDDWYNAIQGVDIVLLPYTAERYRYNWSAIYFTAIGCKKPVLITETLNPEVMAEFQVGEVVDLANFEIFAMQLEKFVNQYDQKKELYQDNLLRANDKYGKSVFIKNLLE